MNGTMRTIAAVALTAAFSAQGETLAELGARLGRETSEAYAASPYSALSKDYFLRFSRDPDATPEADETAVAEGWRIVHSPDAAPLTVRMAEHLADFLTRTMNVTCPVEAGEGAERTIVLADAVAAPGVNEEAFAIAVGADRIAIAAGSPEGVRDGIVKLTDRIGFRGAPYLAQGVETYEPKLRVRLGTTPMMGSFKDLVFMGYNAVFAAGGSLHGLSRSDAIPALAERRVPGLLEAGAASVAAAKAYGLKTYAFVDTREKFAKDAPVFQEHPDLRGALTWKADGEYVVCTEHPLAQRYLAESVQDLFRETPGLDGLVFIIGGEGFYHCFMRPYGVEKGHTNCARCEAVGAEQVVANLCNRIAAAAREIHPEAEIVAWPYSAEHVWSVDPYCAGFISKLEPGTAIFTEIEKSEYLEKPEGVRKSLWDYSIDMIGPGPRAQAQIEACRAAGIPIYLKSEPELGFEAPRLPHIPCMDRWADRAIALATCGADGAWVFPAFRPNYGTSASELAKYFWWEPAPDKDALLNDFAARLFGPEAGPHMREAWRHVSDAIPFSPELPSYYKGPYYLGPAHPMVANPEAEIPELFYGRYLFLVEMATDEGMAKLPTFETKPTGNPPVFLKYYRAMRDHLHEAVKAVDAAAPLVPERNKAMFEAEASPIRWFYHTARAEANFYESCLIRDALLAEEKPEDAQELYDRWKAVLEDERDNARQALPVAKADMRLDGYYGGDHTFSHMDEMVEAKLALIETEITEFLPSVADKLGLEK